MPELNEDIQSRIAEETPQEHEARIDAEYKAAHDKVKAEKNQKQEPAGLASAYTGQGMSSGSLKDVLKGAKGDTGKPQDMSKTPQDISKDEVLPKVTRTRSVNKVVGKVDPKTLIAAMQEKILCIQYIDKIEIPVIAITGENAGAGLSKEAREVLVALQKAIEIAKNNAISSIQQL